MKRKLKVGCDVDDVLLKCNAAVPAVLKEQGIEMSLYDIESWDEKSAYFEERRKLFNDEDFVKNQPLYEGAQAFIEELVNRGCEVMFITAVPPKLASIRAEQLLEYFPSVKKENIVITSRKDLFDVDVLIDDAPHNIQNSHAKWPILFRQPWNKEVTGMLSANNYDDILSLIDTIMSQYSYSENDEELIAACLVGPSGSCKTEIARELARYGHIIPKIWTTSEKQEKYYNTISKEEFEKLKDDKFFAETTVYAGCYYGVPHHTLISAISKARKKGKKVVMPSDVCGANSLRRQYDGVKAIYIKRDKSALIANILKKDIPERQKVLRIIALDEEEKNEALCDAEVIMTNPSAAAKEIIAIMEGN